MRKLLGAIVIIAASGTCAAAASHPPVRLVGRAPALAAGEAWNATLRVAGPETPRVGAIMGRRSLRFRVRRVRAHTFRARVAFPAAGRWRLVARLGLRRFALATVRVAPSRTAYRFAEPGQVLATPDGSLLVAERGARGQVSVVRPQDGSVRVFARGLPAPYGLAFAPDRTVLVSTGDGVFRVPPHGGSPRRVVSGSFGPLLPENDRSVFYGSRDEVGRLDLSSGATVAFGPPVSAPHSLVRGSDGRLLVPDSAAGRILAIDPATGASSLVAEGLRTPLGMTLDVTGDIVVVEYSAGTLVRVSAGGAKTTVARGLRKPYSLTLSRDGDYYVVEAGELGTETGTLKQITRDGRVSAVRLHAVR